MSTNFVGIDIFFSRSVAEQVAESYRRDSPPRNNVKVIESDRITLFECPTDINSCVVKYDKSGPPLFIVYSEG